MYALIFLCLISLVFLSMIPTDISGHRSGCHRWHSCPSHTGSYECGDLGHECKYSSNDDSDEENDDDDNKQEKDDGNDKEEKSSTLPKSTKIEGIELSGPVTYIVDGDTLDVNDIRVRLALVDTPERGDIGYQPAKTFVKDLCLGKQAEVDIDDGQRGGDAYGREIGVVYCDGVNINSELLDKDLASMYTEYCDISEFANDRWADC